MKEKVINIAKEVFQNDVNENSKIGDFDSWDSLGQLNLFMALESELDVKFSHEEIIDSDSVEKIVTLIESKK
jgi:acyl carrier protein